MFYKKVKTSFIVSIIFCFLFLAAVSVGILYRNKFSNSPKFKRYKAFGIDIPVKYQIHGIDISHYQKSIHWPLVKEMKVKNVKIGFAFIKATEGVEGMDGMFKTNWKNAEQAGIVKGAYHYFICSKSGKAQAENFIEVVKLKKGDLPPVLDVEETNGVSITDLQQRVSDWLLMVEKKYKTRPIIYTNVDFYKNFLSGRFDDYPLWIAHYLEKEKPRIKREWSFWQHNEAGRVNGINAYVDFNVFNGDSAAFQKILVK